MSIEIPVINETEKLPYQILSEINIMLDERQPLPLRAALLVKWYAFFNAKTGGRIEVPRLEELTPKNVKRYATKLVGLVAEQFFHPKPSVPL